MTPLLHNTKMMKQGGKKECTWNGCTITSLCHSTCFCVCVCVCVCTLFEMGVWMEGVRARISVCMCISTWSSLKCLMLLFSLNPLYVLVTMSDRLKQREQHQHLPAVHCLGSWWSSCECRQTWLCFSHSTVGTCPILHQVVSPETFSNAFLFQT